MGSSSQVSVIGYSQQHERFRLGSYGQWTASDAVVLYYDGIVSKGTDALYPVPDPANPLGGSMDRSMSSHRGPMPRSPQAVLHLPVRQTLSFELLYNGAGYDDEERGTITAFGRTRQPVISAAGRWRACPRRPLPGR